MHLLWPFWNSTEVRLRAFWRIIIHLLGYLFAPPALNWLVGPPLSRALAMALPELAVMSERLVLFGLRLVAVIAVTWLVVRLIDNRAWADMGMNPDPTWWVDFGFGLVLGASLMSFVFTTQYAAGWVRVREVFAVGLADTSFAIAMLGPLVVSLVISITEELLTRGYQLRNLAEGFNFSRVGPARAILASWVLSSSLFGLLHVFNPNATLLSTLYLMLAGLFFGLGYVLTGRLGLAIGLHFTWNFFQGNVYGFPVSGNIVGSASVLTIEQGGPALWTGGAFGPEAGLIGILAILLGCLLTLAWVRVRYGRVQLYLPFATYVPRRSNATVAHVS